MPKLSIPQTREGHRLRPYRQRKMTEESYEQIYDHTFYSLDEMTNSLKGANHQNSLQRKEIIYHLHRGIWWLNLSFSWVWWSTPVILSLGRLRQKGCKSEASLGYIIDIKTKKNFLIENTLSRWLHWFKEHLQKK